jgi:hypothetical protein
MTHVFLLMVYLGTQTVSQDMYFRDIDQCRYFAERLNNQPSVPNRTAGEDVPKTRSYVAVCEPRRVNPKTTKVY